MSDFNAAKKIVNSLKVACVTLDGIQIYPGGKVQANIRRYDLRNSGIMLWKNIRTENEKLQQAEVAWTDIQARFEALRNLQLEVGKVKNDINNAEYTRQNLENLSTASLVREIEVKRKEYAEKQAEKESITLEIEAKQNEIDDLKEQIRNIANPEEMKKKLKKDETALKSLTEKLKKTQKDLNRIDPENERLRGEIETAEANIQAYDGNCAR